MENGNCTHKEKYAVELPYVTIDKVCPNQHYGAILLKDYAGMESELTAITQYVYQHYFADECKDVQTALMGIAMVEMKHLEMLGDLIKKLGVDPQYRTFYKDKCYYWNGNFPSKTKTIKAILLDNIAGEKAAIANYKKTIELICDEAIDSVIKRIIMDEELHLAIFSKLYSKYA